MSEYLLTRHKTKYLQRNPCNIYRVSGLSCPEAGGCKSAILRGFLDVFSLFGPCMVGAISFRYSWTTGMKKKFRNPHLKKGQISGLAQIDIFSDFLVLGVANFRINYLRQFSFNFENLCAHLAANFRKSEKCQFEQILKSDLFSGQDFWTFFSFLWSKNT